ncbi:LysM peptidoglycan-binding domain-containing protein [Agromyces sp. SYSU K20354]|uniref:LysM peptidoglycan-binding domain-containing protein n=1 Tax=Agromyces cavernae TaxID=2898659 RepID=UPI001E2DBB5C|nr:LysM peptidoglycan-binding domain-containing protein [Agromyces cavernae]MCD2441915.1 LysM peptidoglycan-binding domain-containing protein [Agromyces cavernae]
MVDHVDGVGGRTTHDDERRRPRGIRGALALPLAIASTIAVTLGIAAPADAAPHQVKRQPKAKAQSGAAKRASSAAATAVPAEIVVADGDTVSGIAERYGLSTAEVLAQNGLSWSSLIFPGQRLALPGTTSHAAPPPSPAAEIAKHTVVAGDTVSGIAEQHGLDLDLVLRANGLGRQSLIFPGETIVLPSTEVATSVEVPPPAAPSPAVTAGGTHVVVAGDTVWDLAERHDLSVAQLIDANGLDGAGTIRPGQELTVPRPATALPVASVTVPLTDEMRANAVIIVETGRRLGVPDAGIVVALAAAAQESSLRNLHRGDRDSQGLFQQRPSEGWGTVDQVLDPVRATTAFYGGEANPNPGRTRGLLDVEGWESMTVTEAAQAVQLSAHPDHYAKWEVSARAWLAELG